MTHNDQSGRLRLHRQAKRQFDDNDTDSDSGSGDDAAGDDATTPAGTTIPASPASVVSPTPRASTTSSVVPTTTPSTTPLTTPSQTPATTPSQTPATTPAIVPTTTTTTTPVATTRAVTKTSERITTPEEEAETTTTASTTPVSPPSPSSLPLSLSTTTDLPSSSVTVVVVSASQTPSASGTLASSGASNFSSGPSTGAVIGIVAGSLLAVIVVAALVTQVLKRRRRSGDDDDTSPFERDEYRRGSVMLEDDLDAYGEADHSPDPYYAAGGAVQMQQITEYANLDRSNTMGSQGPLALPTLARNGTLGTPRPPSGLIQHVAYQQQHQKQHHLMAPPNFGPRQVLPSIPPPIAYPTGPAAATGLNYANSMSGLSRSGSGGAFGSGPYRPPSNDRQVWQQPSASLDRQGSISSIYSTRSDQPHAGAPNGYPSHGAGGASDEQAQRLSLVREEHESDTQSMSYPIARSGTPTNSNVQQTFFSHRHEDLFDGVSSMNGTSGTVLTSLPGYESWMGSRPTASDRGPTRRLSVVNGGLNDFDREEGEGYHGAYRR